MQSTGSLFEGIILPSIESGDGTTLRKCSPLGIVKPVKGPIWSFRRGKENTTVVKELLEDAIERGLDREERYLTVVEGSRERRTEVRPVLGIEPKDCHVMAAEKLCADDTPVPVLTPGRGKTKAGRYGRMFGMTGPPEKRHPRQCGSPIRRIARPNIQRHT